MRVTLIRPPAAQVAKPGMAAVSKTAGWKASQVQILPWALYPVGHDALRWESDGSSRA